MMGVLEFVVSMTGVVFGCTTLMGWVLYRKASKRMKDAEARLKEVEALDKEHELNVRRMMALHTDIDTLNVQLTNAYKDKGRAEEIIDDKTRKIRELQDRIYGLLEERRKDAVLMAGVEAERDYYRAWHCERETNNCEEGCLRRRPAQNPPLKYRPFKKN